VKQVAGAKNLLQGLWNQWSIKTYF